MTTIQEIAVSLTALAKKLHRFSFVRGEQCHGQPIPQESYSCFDCPDPCPMVRFMADPMEPGSTRENRELAYNLVSILDRLGVGGHPEPDGYGGITVIAQSNFTPEELESLLKLSNDDISSLCIIGAAEKDKLGKTEIPIPRGDDNEY